MNTTTEPHACVGIVLAGGRSARMGRDKALLPWRGRPLIDHQIATLHAAGVDRVRVSGDRPEHDGIADSVPDAGPLGGLTGIAAQLADADLLLLPVDMPRMNAALLQRLRTEARDAACLRFAGHVLPMRLRLDDPTRAMLDALMAECEDRARSLRALQLRVGTVELAVPAPDAGRFVDCNTPEQWQELHR